MDMIAIGSKIKVARERAHLTQEELAEIIDISPTHMSVIGSSAQTSMYALELHQDLGFRVCS